MARGHVTQLVVGDVLPLLYQAFADHHCGGLDFQVSTDQHLEGRHGRGREQYGRTRFYTDTKLASFLAC